MVLKPWKTLNGSPAATSGLQITERTSKAMPTALMTVFQVALVVGWYVVPVMLEVPAWVIFMPSLIVVGIVAIQVTVFLWVLWAGSR